MDRTKLKTYAPQARREFIQAMIDRAAFYGLSAEQSEPVVEKGDVAVIGGRSFPIAIARKRKALEDRIKRHGFQQTIEAMAYTWFNRLVAIRYMELHGYLEHGYRVLSHPEGKLTPEIVEHAEHVELAGLNKDRVIDLKLAGYKEGELYRLLLTAQCNALHRAMPFLFERIDDETELLLPDNLLNSDSLIRKLVNEIDESDWQEVEIIGWLYQFYISERKDEVIGKVVASEDIPAATQLFTPNWIVKYLAQNTLGRQWLATYPQSALRQQMEYYIEPAEQTPEVQEQLNASTPTSLNPEELTLLDPACGSGHILVEAYDLFKAIYQERGYRAKDIPALILQKNLFGLEIDDRAAQLAAFALMMKARADDRRIFDGEAKPNIVAIQESEGGQKQAEEIAYALGADPGSDMYSAICEVHALFESARTFGSLIQIPPKLATMLCKIEKHIDAVVKHGNLTQASAHVLVPLLQQSKLLARQYDVLVANPPYMGGKYMPPLLKRLAISQFKESSSDLYALFITRCMGLATSHANIGYVTPFVWMFIQSFEDFRLHLASKAAITSLIQLEYNAFEPACVPVCCLTINVDSPSALIGDYISLSDFKGHENQSTRTLEAIRSPNCTWRYRASVSDFSRLPSNSISYWLNPQLALAFEKGEPLGEVCEIRAGITTGDNDKFIRCWHEVAFATIGFKCKSKSEAWERPLARWFPLKKGGPYRKWYGNNDFVIRFDKPAYTLLKAQGNHCASESNYFRRSLTWSDISNTSFGVRHCDEGFIFTTVGHSIFGNDEILSAASALLCSTVADEYIGAINPTFHANPGDVAAIPYLSLHKHPRWSEMKSTVGRLVQIAREDWDSNETSWDFAALPLIGINNDALSVQQWFEQWKSLNEARRNETILLEESNNRSIMEIYGVDKHAFDETMDKSITLYRCDVTEDIRRLLSYAIGCIMGRYSLDSPGLIYAHGGNQGFDAAQYKTFRADDDGIIPLLETDWGIRDDATNRLEEFISLVWPKEHLDENLKFVADSLGPNSGEQPRETIRRYLATAFYKHHLSMYKKRPIYWLFSSGRQRAFQCLVYLHRYNEGTLARIRTEYVIPLQGQIVARIDQLEGDKAKATSTSHRNKIQKEQDKLKKQQAELATFEEKLKHYADMRISLDLDDGVKVNYAMFGDLLAESKAITGGKDDE